nr:YcaO-like family protein [Patescibacteria group bacterium]
ERYSLLIAPKDPPDMVGRFSELNNKALDPINFWRYSTEQINKVDFPFKNMRNDSVLNWREVTSFIGENILIPEDYIYINMVRPSDYHNNTTSGCASHNNYYKACLNALLELIERDNIMRHWARGRPGVHISISSLGKQIKKEVFSITSLGYDLKIINCSRFESIHTFIVLIINKAESRPKIAVASACSVDPRQAILKALDEAKGGLFISLVLEETTKPRIVKLKDLSDPRDHANYYRDPKNKKILNHYFNASKVVNLNTCKSKYKNQDEKLLLKEILLNLKEKGVDVYFKDVTFGPFKNFGISVVRAISPQLIPLVFGAGMLKLEHEALGKIDYSPNGMYFPHPFA